MDFSSFEGEVGSGCRGKKIDINDGSFPVRTFEFNRVLITDSEQLVSTCTHEH